MRLSIIIIVFLKELREMLRDRRSLTIMFGIPLVLYPGLTILISTIGLSREKELKERVVQVVVENEQAAPNLMRMLREPGSGFNVPSTKPARAQAELAAGKLDAIIEVPPNAEAELLASRPAEISVRLDRSRTPTIAAERRIERLLSNYEKWVIEQRLEQRNVPSQVLAPLKRQTQDIATGGQRFGKMLALALPVLLLMTGMLGALFPALNATTTERELGTLETLLVTPAGRMELLIAKGALVLLSGLLTAGLNMLSMSLVLWRVLSMETGLGNLTISPSALALSYLAAVPSLITFATLVLIVGLVARNFREANSLATPVMLIPLASMIVGILEPPMSPGLLITPVANTTIIIREVLTERVSAGPFVLAFISSCAYAGLLLSAAARVFTNEQLVNPSWEPVSLAGFRAGLAGANRPRRLPAVDEALALFAVTLLLNFYIQPSLMKHGLVPLLLISQIALLATPALLLAWIARYRWKETFSFRRPRIEAVIGAILLGIGLTAWVQLAAHAQSQFWTRDPAQEEALRQLLEPPLRQHPILISLLIGVLAGVCEELLYRGPIFAGLRRRLSVWPAIAISALLFAAAHLDLFGMPIRAFLGVLLGWIVVHTGSIIPAMLMHAAYDIAQLLILGLHLHRGGEVEENRIGATMLVVCAILIIAGAILLRRGEAAGDHRDNGLASQQPIT